MASPMAQPMQQQHQHPLLHGAACTAPAHPAAPSFAGDLRVCTAESEESTDDDGTDDDEDMPTSTASLRECLASDEEDGTTSTTSFRQWLASDSSPCGGASPERVPGLRGAFEEAGFSSFVPAVEAWCEENGAVFLAEVEEELDDISAVIHLPPSQRDQLRLVLARATYANSVPPPPRPPVPLMQASEISPTQHQVRLLRANAVPWPSR